jgi:hypothetical protein
MCDRCAEKWVYGHKCSSIVQWHVIQEMLELFPEDGSSNPESDTLSKTSNHQLCLCLSECAALGVDSTMSMKLLGHIYGKEVLILLDSGSSAAFLNSSIAALVLGQV